MDNLVIEATVWVEVTVEELAVLAAHVAKKSAVNKTHQLAKKTKDAVYYLLQSTVYNYNSS